MNRKVLILEDEMLIALTYKMELTNSGFEVAGICLDVDSAEQQMEKEEPDYALVDIHLQGNRDGIDFVNACRNRDVSTRFIFVTGNFDESTRSRAEQLNPLGFFVKPVQISELLPLLNQTPGETSGKHQG